MTESDFYRKEPTGRTSWRMAVLFGANTRTYKFALAHALLHHAANGRDDVSLEELAGPYALALAEHAVRHPQAPSRTELGENDFLVVCGEEATESLRTGQPTERLLYAAIDSMPGMVMQKFHNLHGQDGIPHRFYDLRGRGRDRLVVLSPELRDVAGGGNDALDDELDARWSLVEASFDAGISTALARHGLVLEGAPDERRERVLVDPVRRSPVTGVRAAVAGFQYGRCFYCMDALPMTEARVHIDHVYPFSLMNRILWRGPQLDQVWNLVLADEDCNARKSARLPTEGEVQQLRLRNEAIVDSPHPLRWLVERTMRLPSDTGPSTSAKRLAFLLAVDNYVHEGGSWTGPTGK